VLGGPFDSSRLISPRPLMDAIRLGGRQDAKGGPPVSFEAEHWPLGGLVR
jgi:hypothetical protein